MVVIRAFSAAAGAGRPAVIMSAMKLAPYQNTLGDALFHITVCCCEAFLNLVRGCGQVIGS